VGAGGSLSSPSLPVIPQPSVPSYPANASSIALSPAATAQGYTIASSNQSANTLHPAVGYVMPVHPIQSPTQEFSYSPVHPSNSVGVLASIASDTASPTGTSNGAEANVSLTANTPGIPSPAHIQHWQQNLSPVPLSISNSTTSMHPSHIQQWQAAMAAWMMTQQQSIVPQFECQTCKVKKVPGLTRTIKYRFLAGDDFYHFVCADCRGGEEIFQRLNLVWYY
jgi:hypothetical protein